MSGHQVVQEIEEHDQKYAGERGESGVAASEEIRRVQGRQKVKAERQRWHDEFEAEQKRRHEEAEREREFTRRGAVISKAAQALQLSRLVRRLAVCVGNSVHLNKLENESLTRMRTLLEWCSEYANEIDPTCNPEVLLRSFYGKESGLLDP